MSGKKMTPSKRTGMPPATLVSSDDMEVSDLPMRLIDYQESEVKERLIDEVKEATPFKSSPTVTWIDAYAVGGQRLGEIGQIFDIHPLVLEDIQTDQRPKMESFDDYFFIILKMLDYDQEKREVTREHVCLILRENLVMSFQEREGDVFDPIRERIRTGKGRIRTMGADYLAYSLMDAIVDHYFTILERLTDRIEDMEEELISDPSQKTLSTIHHSKRDLIDLRKAIWPLREVIAGIERSESPLVREETLPFFRDLYDHTIQIMDTTESLRDMVSGMLDIYLSIVSNRMNEVMKVLTIIATIFIPLTFIAGIYGMNFVFMPELDMKYGYFGVLAVMLSIGAIMTLYFHRKGWL